MSLFVPPCKRFRVVIIIVGSEINTLNLAVQIDFLIIPVADNIVGYTPPNIFADFI